MRLGASVVDDDEIGLICYVCGWAQGFELAYSTPPDMTNSVWLVEWLCMQLYVICLAQGCWFNPQSSKKTFFLPLRGLTLNIGQLLCLLPLDVMWT